MIEIRFDKLREMSDSLKDTNINLRFNQAINFIEEKTNKINIFLTKDKALYYPTIRELLLKISGQILELKEFSKTLKGSKKSLIMTTCGELENPIIKQLDEVVNFLATEQTEFEKNIQQCSLLYCQQVLVTSDIEIMEDLDAALQRASKFLGRTKPRCFISYAWPTTENRAIEFWVQPFLKTLHAHLKEAGIIPLLDIIDHSSGGDIAVFTHKIETSDFAISILTQSLHDKHRDSRFKVVQTELALLRRKYDLDILTEQVRVFPYLISGTPVNAGLDEHNLYRMLHDRRGHSYIKFIEELIGWILFPMQISPAEYGQIWQDFYTKHPALQFAMPVDTAIAKTTEQKYQEEMRALEANAFYKGLLTQHQFYETQKKQPFFLEADFLRDQTSTTQVSLSTEQLTEQIEPVSRVRTPPLGQDFFIEKVHASIKSAEIKKVEPVCMPLKRSLPTLPPLSNEFIETDETIIAENSSPNVTRGRKDLLNEINMILHKKNNSRQPCNILRLYGMGGIGKSTLAIHYGHEIQDGDKPYDMVFFINATSKSIEASFTQLARQVFQLDDYLDKYGERADVVGSVYMSLDNVDRWLLIFDNALDFETIKRFLPAANSTFLRYKPNTQRDIIITSRSNQWSDPLLYITPLSPKDTEGFIAKFFSFIRSPDKKLKCLEIAKQLGYHPLALIQASNYMNNKEGIAMTPDAYLEKLRSQTKLTLTDSAVFSPETGNWDYEEDVFKALKLSVDKFLEEMSAFNESSRELSRLVLLCLRYCNANNYIPINLLESLTFIIAPTLMLEETSQHLVKYLYKNSIIHQQTDTAFSIHQLMQIVSSDTSYQKEDDDSFAIILKALHKNFDLVYYKPVSFRQYTDWAAQVEFIFETYSSYLITADQTIVALLYQKLGDYYYAAHQREKALKYYECAQTRIDNHKLQIDICDLAKLNISFGQVYYRSKGDFDKASQYLDAALKLYGDDRSKLSSLESVGALIELGHISANNRYLKRAQLYYERCLDYLNTLTVSVDAAQVAYDVSVVQHSMASIFLQLADNKKAIELYEKSNNFLKSFPVSLNTLTQYHNLIKAYIKLKKYAKAIEAHTIFIEQIKFFFGDKSVDYIHALYELAHLYLYSNELQKAQAIYEIALNIILSNNILSTEKSAYQPTTLINLAANFGHREYLEMQIEQGLNVNAMTDEYENTLLHGLVISDLNLNTIPWILTAGASTQIYNSVGMSPFFYAAYCGQIEVMRHFLEKCDAKITDTNAKGQTALWWATINSQFDAIKWLVGRSAAINVAPADNRNILILCAQSGNLEITRYFWELATDQHRDFFLNAKDNTGMTAALWAAQLGHPEVIEELIHYRKKVLQDCNSDGDTIYSIPIKNEHFSVVEVLMKFDPDWPNNEYEDTILHWAIRNDYQLFCEYWFTHHPEDRERRNKEGYTPLLLAVVTNKLKIAQALVMAGANLSARLTNNNRADGDTLAMLALRHEDDLVQWAVGISQNFSFKNSYGISFYHLIILFDRVEACIVAFRNAKKLNDSFFKKLELATQELLTDTVKIEQYFSTVMLDSNRLPLTGWMEYKWNRAKTAVQNEDKSQLEEQLTLFSYHGHPTYQIYNLWVLAASLPLSLDLLVESLSQVLSTDTTTQNNQLSQLAALDVLQECPVLWNDICINLLMGQANSGAPLIAAKSIALLQHIQLSVPDLVPPIFQHNQNRYQLVLNLMVGENNSNNPSAYLNALSNLMVFAEEIGFKNIEFDKNNTCILGIDNEFSLHITYEPNTRRLYLYSPLLDGLPKNESKRLDLYLSLLEGGMLGGQVAGGGVGVACKEELVLIHATLNMEYTPSHKLKEFASIFVETVEKWRARCKEASLTTRQTEKKEKMYESAAQMKLLTKIYHEVKKQQARTKPEPIVEEVKDETPFKYYLQKVTMGFQVIIDLAGLNEGMRARLENDTLPLFFDNLLERKNLDANILALTLDSEQERASLCNILESMNITKTEIPIQTKTKSRFSYLTDIRQSAWENAKTNLKIFGEELKLPALEFDENNTCILGIDDEFSLHLTFEPNSEQLYLYSPLLDGFPKDQNVMLELCQELLQGSMLGGQMAGGGVGIARREELVLMHLTIPMLNAAPDVLRQMAPLYVATVEKWREKCALIYSKDTIAIEASSSSSSQPYVSLSTSVMGSSLLLTEGEEDFYTDCSSDSYSMAELLNQQRIATGMHTGQANTTVTEEEKGADIEKSNSPSKNS